MVWYEIGPISKLGIKRYKISPDLMAGCGNTAIGIGIDGKHYIIMPIDIQEGITKKGIIVPKVAYELLLGKRKKADVKPIREPEMLEKIASAASGHLQRSAFLNYGPSLKPVHSASCRNYN